MTGAAPHTAVVTRLVRNCALGRVIQYAAAYRFDQCRLHIVIASEAKQSIPASFAARWIASLRSQ